MVFSVTWFLAILEILLVTIITLMIHIKFWNRCKHNWEYHSILDVDTRWNSSYYMLEHLIDSSLGRRCIMWLLCWTKVTTVAFGRKSNKTSTIWRGYSWSQWVICFNSFSNYYYELSSSFFIVPDGSTTDDFGITNMKREIISSLKDKYDNMESTRFALLQ